LGDWIAEDCEVGDACEATTADLYASWRRRAESLGVDAGNARDLGERLRALGFESVRTRKARGWKGLEPRPTDGEKSR
jgi:putative DNA primase/helicase